MARLRAYLLEATYEWLLNHDFTPYIMIDANNEDSDVPEDYVDEDRIVLNISPEAIHNLHIDLEGVSFEASFSGQTTDIFAPTDAIIALYAKETGQGVYAREDNLGMWVNEGESEEEFDPDERLSDEEEPRMSRDDTIKAAKKRGLRVIK